MGIQKGLDDGINLLDIEKQYLPAPICNLELDRSNVEDSELQPLSVATMTFPLFVLTLCALSAICVKLWREYLVPPNSRAKFLSSMRRVVKPSYTSHLNKHLSGPIFIENRSKSYESALEEHPIRSTENGPASALEENQIRSTKDGPAKSLTNEEVIKAMEDMQNILMVLQKDTKGKAK